MNIIYFPSKLGQIKNGLQNSYKILNSIISSKINIVNCNNSCKNDLYNNLNNLYITNQYFDKKINIGGDHSMSIATVAHSLNVHKNLKVIWFDAHPDINTYYRSKTKNLHGMPLSYLSGLDYSLRFHFINNKLDLNNLLYIGIRDIDIFEQEIINKYNISYITPHDFNNNPEYCLQKINNFINTDPVHLSFDVDCMDPNIIPCTGTKVINGLMIDQTKFILDNLYDKNIVNIDIAEINFLLGDNKEQKTTINNFLYLFDKYLYL